MAQFVFTVFLFSCVCVFVKQFLICSLEWLLFYLCQIIDVGGKEYKFTWSRELGDLCDIYEECRSGEDGNGLLVESGCAWRKLNVQRILDESTKNHVKRRSEEAERKMKSRNDCLWRMNLPCPFSLVLASCSFIYVVCNRAIVLEPGNPSMKSQLKALAAVEATPWKNFNKKKEAALKKRKEGTLQVVVGPPKSSHRSGLTSTNAATKGRHSSPLPSQPDPFAASSSPLGPLNMSKSLEDAVPSQMTGKQDTNAVSEREIPSRTNIATRNTPGGKGNSGSKPADLQGMLVSLLKDKPNGMTLKALEKAVGDTFPTSIKKIEPIIKKIAKYQAPGRYIMRPAVDLESLNKPQTESGSSPDDNHSQIPAREEFHDQASAPQERSEEKAPNVDLEEMVKVKSKVEEEPNNCEKIDAQHTSPDMVADKKGSDHRSASSSDSESDVSSSSKEGLEGSDEDVDIMTSDDEKESKQKIEASDQKMPLPNPVISPERRSIQNEVEETRPFSLDYQQLQERQNYIGSLFDERENEVKDSSKHEQSDSSDRLYKGKHKRGSDMKNIDEKSEGAKRLKAGSLSRNSNKQGESIRHGKKHSGKDFRAREASVHKDKSHRDGLNEDIHATEKKAPRNSRDDNRSKQSLSMDSYYQKQGETVGKLKEGRQSTQSHFGASPKDKNRIGLNQSPVTNGRGISLQRELSDLELGELRSQNKLAEISSKFRNNESGTGQDIDLEIRNESNRRVPAHASKQDSKRGMVSYPMKESKRQTPNSVEVMAYGGKDSVFADRNHGDQKKRESSSDENSCSYSKYEKDEPELRGPIGTLSQYQEYMQEYRDKFDSYCSLYKILENYKDKFQKLGKDLEYAKDRDMDRYYEILQQMRESYRHCAPRHKRLKKIFVVLHMEVETIKQRIKDFAEAFNK
uniref:OCEL domain-containing protein n=1 Tax=Cajanus cajan TaxID=3821 RepID=A0A151SH34_CAJCA|nr:hypothetical protein KK1_000264 [Cajanus cajan]